MQGSGKGVEQCSGGGCALQWSGGAVEGRAGRAGVSVGAVEQGQWWWWWCIAVEWS